VFEDWAMAGFAGEEYIDVGALPTEDTAMLFIPTAVGMPPGFGVGAALASELVCGEIPG
jgi:hypothetical protein